jgi:hypothetical protein
MELPQENRQKCRQISTIETGLEAIITVSQPLLGLSSLVACISRHYACSMCGTLLTRILSIRHFRVCFIQLFIMATKIFVEIPTILWIRH